MAYVVAFPSRQTPFQPARPNTNEEHATGIHPIRALLTASGIVMAVVAIVLAALG